MAMKDTGVLDEHDDPWEILGLQPEDSPKKIRSAYIELVKIYPPERHPDAFERIRDAYNQLRDPRKRAKRLLEGPDALAPLTELLKQRPVKRRYVGTQPWMRLMNEKTK